MFAGGLVEEVRALAQLERPISNKARQALGYKEVLAYLAGQGSLQETIVQVQTRTRNFAKRKKSRGFATFPGVALPTSRN